MIQILKMSVPGIFKKKKKKKKKKFPNVLGA